MTSENNNKYPSHNPFPQQVFVNLEGISNLDTLRNQGLKTLERKSFQEAKQQLNSYLTKEVKIGKAIGIKGDSGSGKTHLISYLMETAWEYNQDIQQIYVKAGSSDFLSLYRRIMAQIDYQTLQEINTIWLSQIYQKEAQKYELIKDAVNILKENPNLVYKYLNKSIIPASEINQIRLSLVREITHNDDFAQAICYLSDPLLGNDVYDWFLGKKLSDNTLRKLGIKHHIDDIDMAQASLQFWVTVLGKVQQPLLLYVDQAENLLINASEEIKSANIGALKSLTEVFVSNNCLLCLSGITDFWHIFSQNFQNRIQCLEISNLALDEVFNLMKMFISSSDEIETFTSYEDIYPYTKNAIIKILLFSGGNTGQILYFAYETFEEVQPLLVEGTKCNPRRIKRFINAFWVLSAIANETNDSETQNTLPQEDRRNLAKILLIQMRFPKLYYALVDDLEIVATLTHICQLDANERDSALALKSSTFREFYEDKEIKTFIIKTKEIPCQKDSIKKWVILTKGQPIITE